MNSLNYINEKSELSKEYLDCYNTSILVIDKMYREKTLTEKEKNALEENVMSTLYLIKLKKDLENPKLKENERKHIQRKVAEYEKREQESRRVVAKHLKEFNKRVAEKLQEKENAKKKAKGMGR